MNTALVLAKNLDRVATDTSGTPVRASWARVLGVPDGSPELALALSVIHGQFEEVRSQIGDSTLSDRAKGLYANAVAVLMPYASPFSVAQHSGQQLYQQRSQIDLLHLAADALPHRLVPDVQPVTLDTLCEELEGIRDSAREAGLEAEVLRLIERSLNTLLMVLRSYNHFGPDGAARIYGSVAAELARASIEAQAKSPAARSLLQRTIGAVKKIGAVVIFSGAVVSGAHELLTDGTDLVGLVSGATEPSPDTDATKAA